MDEIFVSAFIDEIEKIAAEKEKPPSFWWSKERSHPAAIAGTLAGLGGMVGGEIAERSGERAHLKRKSTSPVGAKRMKWGRRASIGGGLLAAGSGTAELVRRYLKYKKEKAEYEKRKKGK